MELCLADPSAHVHTTYTRNSHKPDSHSFSSVFVLSDFALPYAAAKILGYDSGGDTVGAVSPSNYQWEWLPARSSDFRGNVSFNPNQLNNVNNLFVDDVANSNKGSPKAGGGYRGELLIFTGFDPNEACGFSGDMDPNSVAGLTKGSIDSGSGWDVGGVSGAEMTGSIVTVLFDDGSFASTTLSADGSQAGSGAVLIEGGPVASAPVLGVNGVGPGGSGSYNNGGTPLNVSVSGSAGSQVRVSMAKGFDALTNTETVANGQISIDALVAARLEAQFPVFPANNAYEWTHQVVTIPPSGSITVSGFSVDGDGAQIAGIAFSAVVIDTSGNPLSPATAPIRLRRL